MSDFNKSAISALNAIEHAASEVIRQKLPPVKEYVLGFALTKNKRWVVLIQKTKPEFQAGKLNGVGGKIEEGETPKEAMVREFHEETGCFHEEWKHYATLNFSGSRVYVFSSIFEIPNDWVVGLNSVDILISIYTPYKRFEIPQSFLPNVRKKGWPTEETPCIVATENLPENIMTNLSWLIPMTRDVGFTQPLEITYREENDSV